MHENRINQSVKGKYKKYSDEEKRNYYNAFEKSGLNPVDFCRVNGLSKSAFYHWSRKFRQKSDTGFLPLMIKSSPFHSTANSTKHAKAQESRQSTELIQVSISFANNHMQLNVSMSTRHLALFIQEIGYATTIIR